MPKAKRQPVCRGRYLPLSRASEASEPMDAPSQKVELTMRSTVPRTLPGMSSSTAELMAAYSPPMPRPVKKRQKEKKRRLCEKAVQTVATE